MSGNEGNSNSVNVLMGGRLYLNGAEKANRLYMNLLWGGNYQSEELNNVKKAGELSLGFSGGGFLELNRVLIGLSYDTPQNIVLKAGYVF